MPPRRSPFPVSDHCDGTVFFNPGGPGVPGVREILKWQRTRQTAPWPSAVVVPPAPALVAVQPGTVAVTWINHASFLARAAGLNVLIDPVFSRRCGPLGRVVAAEEELT